MIRIVLGFQSDSAIFRAMSMSEASLEEIENLSAFTYFSRGEVLALLFPEKAGNLVCIPEKITAKQLIKRKKILTGWNENKYEALKTAYEAIWNDLQVFPVSKEGISYENSWMFERNYGGKRGHEGTDLISTENLSGYYPVISITDGTVEKMGWLEQGGYRVGIRSPSGGYFYYAHLDSFSEDIWIGKKIKAGQMLGYMGDTGYGEEGTTGKFPVHLHLGIYIGSDEVSINPYWILRWLEKRQEDT